MVLNKSVVFNKTRFWFSITFCRFKGFVLSFTYFSLCMRDFEFLYEVKFRKTMDVLFKKITNSLLNFQTVFFVVEEFFFWW